MAIELESAYNLVYYYQMLYYVHIYKFEKKYNYRIKISRTTTDDVHINTHTHNCIEFY